MMFKKDEHMECLIMTIINLEFLNQYSGALTIIFSALVAIATVVYAILTWRLVSETRKLREAQTEPKVFISIQPREEWISLIDLVIQNIGFGPAYDINFEICPDFEYANGKFLSDLGLVKNGLNHLAPAQKLEFFFTSLVENFEEKTRTPIEIRVTYQNALGNAYEDTYLIDFSSLIGLTQLGKPPMHSIADDIKQIKEDIKHLSSGISRMKVIVYTEKDIQRKEREFLKERIGSKNRTEMNNDIDH
jgi:hypothetical protein